MGPSEDPFVERLVRLTARWGMVTPVVTILEANKPLSFVGSQGLLMLQPLADLFVPREITAELADLLADRQRLERLIARLENLNGSG